MKYPIELSHSCYSLLLFDLNLLQNQLPAVVIPSELLKELTGSHAKDHSYVRPADQSGGVRPLKHQVIISKHLAVAQEHKLEGLCNPLSTS